ncbi:MAG: HAMP domain-containing sensor histidine kinase [Bacteroidota bacterium]|nr:HAMP domain-containing sensor histidine kinase [Bacteroidota bacterium]
MNSPRNTVAVRKQTRHPTSAALFQSLAPQKVIQQLPVQFASALAHEIRNPLANIQLAVEILKPTLCDQDQHLYLDFIMRGSERINEVVAELLASFRTGKRQKKHESVHKLLDEVLAMTGDRIALKNIKVRKDYSTVDCKVMMDKPKVIIALTNIIINAIDAMPAVNGQLILATKSINDKCVLEIRDNGIGISSIRCAMKNFSMEIPCASEKRLAR